MSRMKRREFIRFLGGAATAWPLAARAQQSERMRRIIVLMGIANDAEAQARAVALRQGLQVLGWTKGRNIQIDYSFADGDVERMRVYAKEAVASGADLILAVTNPALQAIRNATRSQPIVFLQVSDPVGGGFVDSLAHPGGNITGFTNFEPEMGGKWLQTLKEIAPAVEHVAVVLHPETSAHAGFLRTAETASVALGIKVTALGVHNVNEIEPAITQLALVPKGGLIVAPHPVTRGKLTIDLAAHHRLPAIYPFAFHAREGGLVAYGIDQVDQWRSAATYVDRILRGAKPADLPVQQPTKYELVINLKTAKALGLDVPPMLLGRADEVIE
jgi:putative tryptophan/tyrosine transport system substrate-binding protein